MAKFQGSRFSPSYPIQAKKRYHPKSAQTLSQSPFVENKRLPEFIIQCEGEAEYMIYEENNCKLEDVKGFARCLTKFGFRIVSGDRKKLLYKGK